MRYLIWCILLGILLILLLILFFLLLLFLFLIFIFILSIPIRFPHLWTLLWSFDLWCISRVYLIHIQLSPRL